MLKIENLHVTIDDDQKQQKNILQGLNLQINPGEVHAIMGPNGSGKSTLGNVLVGREGYSIQEGNILFENQDLLPLSVEQRALQGIFLAHQYPVEIPGVNNTYFLRTALNNIRKKQGLPLLDAVDFMKLVRSKLKEVGLEESFLNRSVNEGFSGGEKKRNEILQMLILQPKLIILDEIDSGLDVDALQQLSQCVNGMKEIIPLTPGDMSCGFIIITHYQRLLDYIIPDFVHVLLNGKIIRSGDATLAKEIELKGYGWLC